MSAPLRISAISCAATAVALTALALGAVAPATTIEKSFADAFDRLEDSQPARPGAHPGMPDPAHIHLSANRSGLPAAPSSPAFGVGDRITLAAREGGSMTYEVIDIRALTAPGLAPGQAPAAATPRLVLVTAIATGLATESDQQKPTVRFIIDADAPASGFPGFMSPAKPHAL